MQNVAPLPDLPQRYRFPDILLSPFISDKSRANLFLNKYKHYSCIVLSMLIIIYRDNINKIDIDFCIQILYIKYSVYRSK